MHNVNNFLNYKYKVFSCYYISKKTSFNQKALKNLQISRYKNRRNRTNSFVNNIILLVFI